jgi:L,D-transpeptidase catalytic domain
VVVGAAITVGDRGANIRAASGAHSLAAEIPAQDPLGPPPRSGLDVPRPRLLDLRKDGATLWAPVLRSFEILDAPSASAKVVTRVAVSTPEQTANLVLVTGPPRRQGRVWVRVRTTGAAGWAPRDALGGYEAVDTRLVVDTAALTATLFRADLVVFRARIGIGTSAAPTPTGSFYVRNMLTRYRSPFYGPVAFGTSARSTLTDWPAGGFVGIHGTNRPDLLPGRVSHGCIRMRNRDILELARLMPVGTSVEIS